MYVIKAKPNEKPESIIKRFRQEVSSSVLQAEYKLRNWTGWGPEDIATLERVIKNGKGWNRV